MGSIAVVVVLGVLAAVLLTRRSHDDVHSVEHYHRQLHTLEEIRAHPTRHGDGNGGGAEADARRHGRGCGLPGQRLPRVGLLDGAPDRVGQAGGAAGPAAARAQSVRAPDVRRRQPRPGARPLHDRGNEDRAIHSINHRPRRLGGPAAAVGAVLVLVLVLVLTGLHSNDHAEARRRRHRPRRTRPPGSTITRATTTTTTTTAPLRVSAPTAATTHTATYTVAGAAYR